MTQVDPIDGNHAFRPTWEFEEGVAYGPGEVKGARAESRRCGGVEGHELSLVRSKRWRVAGLR